MRSKIAILSALALHVLASPVPVPQTVNTPCHEVHIFLARGSEEPYPGRQSNLVDAICRGISSCGYEDIVYPATFANYCEASVPVGVANGKAQIEAYSTRCPDSKLVLSGYSQGGHIIGDILGGGGGACPMGGTQVTTTGIIPNSPTGCKIVAALIFGDVRHTANQPYNVATGASGNGVWPRSGAQLTSLNQWSGKIRSWCNGGDPVCAGGSVFEDHVTYFDQFSNEAAGFAKSKIRGSSPLHCNSSY